MKLALSKGDTMTIGFWYWLILILSIIFSGYGWVRDDVRIARASNLALLVLLILNGIADFGSPIK